MPWSIHGDGKNVRPGEVVRPGERLSWPRTIGLGSQHVVAMFGATFLVPILTKFPPSTTLLFSGVGTILFLLITRNRVPSYLGSSFAFIAPVIASTQGTDYSRALFGIVVTGAVLAMIGLVVNTVGTAWIHRLMPPAVMGAVVALIGFNLAQASWNNVIHLDAGGSFAPGGKPVDDQHLALALITVLSIVVIAALFRGDQIHVLQTMDIVRRKEAIGNTGRITVHAALIITTKKPIHIELRKHLILLCIQQQVFDDRLLNAHQPWSQGVDHEVNALMLDIGVGSMLQILHKMRRYTEDTADLVHTEFSGGEKLTILRRQGDRFVGHPLFQDCYLMGVISSAIHS